MTRRAVTKSPKPSNLLKFPKISRALDLESFSFLPESELPSLLLGIHIPTDHFRADSGYNHNYRFAPGRKWERIVHDGGGANGKAHYWIGTRLTIHPVRRIAIDRFVERWTGSLDVTASAICNYHSEITDAFHVTCNRSFSLLSSNHFPIDAESVRSLITDNLPTSFDDLIHWDSGIQRATNSVGRWNAVILAGGGTKEMI